MRSGGGAEPSQPPTPEAHALYSAPARTAPPSRFFEKFVMNILNLAKLRFELLLAHRAERLRHGRGKIGVLGAI